VFLNMLRAKGPKEAVLFGDNSDKNAIDRLFAALNVNKLNERGQPNLEAINRIVANIELTNLNIKFFGYQIARALSSEIPLREGLVPCHVGLQSKASTQRDMESDWVRYWCSELKTPVIMHRKQWELAYVLQAIYENGLLQEGARGVGFGCGEEPIASYLASRGVKVTITDLQPTRSEASGWTKSGQHTTSIDRAYHGHLIDRDRFDALVDHQFVDMNSIPSNLRGYDFCWSVCALEHLGSIEKGLAFIERSLAVVRPGGVAVHTTELNISSEGETIDNWPTVLFQSHHFEKLASHLREGGHDVAPLNFDLGDQPMDQFIDLPPWSYDLPENLSAWMGQPSHLKIAIDGFASTCFGLVMRRAS